jgi:hypothetical protein
MSVSNSQLNVPVQVTVVLNCEDHFSLSATARLAHAQNEHMQIDKL